MHIPEFQISHFEELRLISLVWFEGNIPSHERTLTGKYTNRSTAERYVINDSVPPNYCCRKVSTSSSLKLV